MRYPILYGKSVHSITCFFIVTSAIQFSVVINPTYQWFFYFDGLGSLACSHSELILKLESYRQSAGLLERGINPL
jgi:hypothetical protein